MFNVSSLNKNKFYLIISFILWFMIVFMRHSIYGYYPLFYDAPIYVEKIDEILREGIISFSYENNAFDIYTMFAAGLSIFIGTNASLLVMINLGAFLLICANYFLTLTITRSFNTAVLVTFLTVISPSTLYLLANVPAQTLALVLVLFLFVKIDWYYDFNIYNLKSWLAILAVVLIYWIHLERTLSVLMISLMVVYVVFKKQELLRFIIISSIIAFISQAPFLLEHFTFYLNPTIVGEQTHQRIIPSLEFYLTNMSEFGGGNVMVFLISIIGLYSLFKKINEQNNLTSILYMFWSIICLTLSLLLGLLSLWIYIPRWYNLASRLLAIYNSPVLIALGIIHISKNVKTVGDFYSLIKKPSINDYFWKFLIVILIYSFLIILFNVLL